MSSITTAGNAYCGLLASRLLAIGSLALSKTIVCDNGLEFTSKAILLWAKKAGVKLRFIQPGKPTQNAFIESFNGKFRDYCLDLNGVRQSGGCPFNQRYLARLLQPGQATPLAG